MTQDNNDKKPPSALTVLRQDTVEALSKLLKEVDALPPLERGLVLLNISEALTKLEVALAERNKLFSEAHRR